MRVFICAPSECRPVADLAANELRRKGHEILSRWHRGPCEKYPQNDVVRAERLFENIAGIEASDLVLAITVGGSPRTTHAEIGYACARAKVVLWVTHVDDRRTLFDAHPSVELVGADDMERDDFLETIVRHVDMAKERAG